LQQVEPAALDSSSDSEEEENEERQLDIGADVALEGPVRFSDPADRSPLEQKLQLPVSRGILLTFSKD